MTHSQILRRTAFVGAFIAVLAAGMFFGLAVLGSTMLGVGIGGLAGLLGCGLILLTGRLIRNDMIKGRHPPAEV